MSSLITNHATQNVFEGVQLRPVLIESGEHPHLVHLTWQAPMQGDRGVQVYVDDDLVDVVLDPSQRDLVLVLDRSRSRRVELLAVDLDDPDAIWCAQPQLLNSWSPRVRSNANLNFLRDESLPVDARLRVRSNADVLDEASIWHGDTHRSGFGAAFGEGAFGSDAVTGPGLGLGDLGFGPLGSDNNIWRWLRDDLDEGDHEFEIQALTSVGEPITPKLSLEPITVERLPRPPINLDMQPDFTLTWE